MANKSVEADRLIEELSLQIKISANGTIRYYNSQGQLHRKYGPAIIFATGHQEWYLNGKQHRDGEAAVILPSGVGTLWYNHGRLIQSGSETKQ